MDSLTAGVDWAQIATPVIALIGFAIAGWQTRLAKQAAVSAEEQTRLLRIQMDKEENIRREANTPYFSLDMGSSTGDSENVSYNFALRNCGIAPAFQIVVDYRALNRGMDYKEYMKVQAIPSGNNVGITFIYPKSGYADQVELRATYKNIYGNYFRQTWLRTDGVFNLSEPPVPITHNTN